MGSERSASALKKAAKGHKRHGGNGVKNDETQPCDFADLQNGSLSKKIARTTDLKNVAVARLYLDNFPHIKAYWVMIGPQMAQIALSFGADDMDGTVKEEIITHMAGAETDQAIGSNSLVRLIKEAGRVPVQRDTLYNVIEIHK